MNNKTRNFIRSLKSLELSKQVRSDMRSRLVAYSSMHAVPVRPARTLVSFSFLSYFNARQTFVGAMALLLCAGVGTGVAFGAEKSVPGDALYGVKVAIAEPLAEVFAPTVAARAHLHAEYASRRVAEATQLAHEGALTPDKAVALTSALATEAKQANQDADTLAAGGDVAASIEVRTYLESALTADAGTLATAASTSPMMEGTTTQTVLAHVATALQNVSEGRQSGEQAFRRGVMASSSPTIDLALLRPSESEDPSVLGAHRVVRTFTTGIQNSATASGEILHTAAVRVPDTGAPVAPIQSGESVGTPEAPAPGNSEAPKAIELMHVNEGPRADTDSNGLHIGL